MPFQICLNLSQIRSPIQNHQSLCPYLAINKQKQNENILQIHGRFLCSLPDDFIMKVKQINSQSDLISMSSFAGLSYLTIRFSVCIILIWDPCICNLHNLCQTGPSYIRQKPHQQCALNFNEQISKYISFCYSLLSGQFQLKLFHCGKGRQNFASNVTLYPCERFRQNHLVSYIV